MQLCTESLLDRAKLCSSWSANELQTICVVLLDNGPIPSFTVTVGRTIHSTMGGKCSTTAVYAASTCLYSYDPRPHDMSFDNAFHDCEDPMSVATLQNRADFEYARSVAAKFPCKHSSQVVVKGS